MATPTHKIKIGQHMDFNDSSRIVNLPAPQDNNDAVRKVDLDAVSSGINWKDNVRFATTEAINLASASVVDGGTLIDGDRVLVKDQVDPAENGIYVFTSGSLIRTSESPDLSSMVNAVVMAEEGSANAQKSFRQTESTGTDVIFTSFGSSVPEADLSTSGVVKLATSEDVNEGTNLTKAITPSALAGSDFAKKIFDNSGAAFGGADEILFSHNFGVIPNSVFVYEVATNKEVICDKEVTDLKVILRFSFVPVAGSLKIKITA